MPDDKNSQEPLALSVTRWVGSTPSLLIHSTLFLGSFALASLGIVEWERMLLVLTTIVSLEAIYLSIFIQMSLNHANQTIDAVEVDIDEIQKDIDEIQEDVDEIQEDVDEIQKDVDEIEESDEEVGERQEEQQKTLASIEKGLAKLLEDIEKLKDNQKR